VHLAVHRDGLELPYVEQGDLDGVPVVLLHAWLDSRRYFDQLMAELPERIRAFAFDQRRHGDAAKPADGYGLRDFADDVGAFMDAVGLDAAVLAGPSSGGYVAQRVAVDDPGRTLGLALLGSPRSLRGRRPRFADVLATLQDPLDAAFVRGSSMRGWSGVRFPKWSWQRSARRTSRCRRVSGVMRSRSCWRLIHRSTPDGSPRLRWIVWGARDSLLPRADQDRMAAEISHAQLVIYADVGHLPVIEAPERVAADLTALCDAVAARQWHQ
jgi:pimeloyl-ACP methyl ester carboxylesterase